MTTFYTPTGNPLSQTRGTSSLIRAEFIAIAAGFTTANGDITAKGAITGQTWTGTHQFPATTYGVTAAPGASGTGFATLDYVNATATSAILPGQAGKAGYELTTNGTIAAWTPVLLDQVLRSPRTANTILAAADRGTLIDITSGTFTQTFTAAATLGSGWFCYIRNGGTGDITVDPNAAELIDGLASYVMYPGESRLVQCDGTAFTSMVVTPFSKTFLSSGNFTKPPGYQDFEIYAGGGGGGGGGGGSYLWSTYTQNVFGGAGGGGGGIVLMDVIAANITPTVTVTVGAGGVGAVAVVGPAAGTAGAVGGATSFGPFVAAVGGGGGGGGGLATSPASASVGSVYPLGILQSGVGGNGGVGLNGSVSVGSAGQNIGGGISSGLPTIVVGGAAGGANTVGSSGTSAVAAQPASGAGGGGASFTATAAGTGGASVKCAGGGGGGGSTGTGNGGTGGAGGPGFLTISGKF